MFSNRPMTCMLQHSITANRAILLFTFMELPVKKKLLPMERKRALLTYIGLLVILQRVQQALQGIDCGLLGPFSDGLFDGLLDATDDVLNGTRLLLVLQDGPVIHPVGWGGIHVHVQEHEACEAVDAAFLHMLQASDDAGYDPAVGLVDAEKGVVSKFGCDEAVTKCTGECIHGHIEPFLVPFGNLFVSQVVSTHLEFFTDTIRKKLEHFGFFHIFKECEFATKTEGHVEMPNEVEVEVYLPADLQSNQKIHRTYYPTSFSDIYGVTFPPQRVWRQSRMPHFLQL